MSSSAKSLVPVLVLGAALVGNADASTLDPELQQALQAARHVLARGDRGQAEELVEHMTRIRRHDPRPWVALGNLRMKWKATADARNAYVRAAGLAGPELRESIRKRLLGMGGPPLPDRVIHDGEASFRELAALGECWTRRRDPRPGADTCPLDGASFLDAGTRCPNHRAGPPNPGNHRLSARLYTEVVEDETPWIRAAAVRLAPLDQLAGRKLGRFMGERDPAIRQVLLERLFARFGKLREDKLARRLLLGFTWDEDFDVRLMAWTLLHAEGVTPALSGEDFHELVWRADRGQASRMLAAEVYQSQRDELTPVLVDLLQEPRYGGKQAALALLVLQGERAGALAAARAMASPANQALAQQYGAARQLFGMLAQENGWALGATPRDWVEALEELPSPDATGGAPGDTPPER